MKVAVADKNVEEDVKNSIRESNEYLPMSSLNFKRTWFFELYLKKILWRLAEK